MGLHSKRSLIAACLASSSFFLAQMTAISAQEQNFNWPLVIGHRGLGANSISQPENSIPSLIRAFEEGSDAVEFDVQLSSDLTVVLAHDETIDRLSPRRWTR